MINVFPFGTGSAVVNSFAITSSNATSAQRLAYVATASVAGTVLNPQTGTKASVNICLITYDQYVTLLNDPTKVENCNFN